MTVRREALEQRIKSLRDDIEDVKSALAELAAARADPRQIGLPL
jgi:hypothetical protein